MCRWSKRIILNEEVTFLLLLGKENLHCIPFLVFHNSQSLGNLSVISRDSNATFGEENNNAAII